MSRTIFDIHRSYAFGESTRPSVGSNVRMHVRFALLTRAAAMLVFREIFRLPIPTSAAAQLGTTTERLPRHSVGHPLPD